MTEDKTLRKRGRPRLEEAEALEKHLLDAALKEFVEHGYGGATLNSIIRRAEISKTTFYTRYQSKSEIFRQVIESQIEAVTVSDALHPIDNRLDLEEALEQFADRMLARSLKPDLMALSRLMMSESSRFPELAEASDYRIRRGVERVAKFFRDCAKNGGPVVREPDDAALAFILMLRGWYTRILMINHDATDTERREWVQLCVRTLINPLTVVDEASL